MFSVRNIRWPVLWFQKFATIIILGMRLFHSGYYGNCRIRRHHLSDNPGAWLHGFLYSWCSGMFMWHLYLCVHNDMYNIACLLVAMTLLYQNHCRALVQLVCWCMDKSMCCHSAPLLLLIVQAMFASFIPEMAEILGRHQRYRGVYEKPVGVRWDSLYTPC